MGWFGNRLLRGASNRAAERLAEEFGRGPATGMLAFALGHACYPTATYGDKGPQDEIIVHIKQLSTKPCDSTSACKFVEQWLDLGMLSTAEVFQYVWSVAPETLLHQLIASFERVGISLKEDAQTYASRGREYLNNFEWDKAITNFSAAILFDPQLAATYASLGCTYLMKCEWDNAIGAYTAAIEIDPAITAAYRGRGAAYSQKTEWEKAIADYTEAIRLGPIDLSDYYHRADAYRENGMLDEAIADYTEVIRLDASVKYAGVYHSRGEAYRQKGDVARAKQDFEKDKELGCNS